MKSAKKAESYRWHSHLLVKPYKIASVKNKSHKYQFPIIPCMHNLSELCSLIFLIQLNICFVVKSKAKAILA